MDVSSFESDYNYSHDASKDKIGKSYFKTIGTYELTIFIGEWCGDIHSSPKELELDISQYHMLNIEVRDVNSHHSQVNQITGDVVKDYIEQNLNIKSATLKSGVLCGYSVCLSQAEAIYNYLNNIANAPFTLTFEVSKSPVVSGRQECSCRGCSKPNDIGATPCWWCGCDNPTMR